MLEEIVKAGWTAAFPDVVNETMVANIEAWFKFMHAAMLEMTNREIALIFLNRRS